MTNDQEFAVVGDAAQIAVAAIKGCLQCHKIPVPNSSLCPKCTVVAQYKAGAKERRNKKSQETIDHRKMMAEALATSPLKAENPDYGKPASRQLGAYDETYVVRQRG